MNIIALNCLLYDSLASGTLLFLMKRNPRYMMQDYPKEIIKNVERQTAKEKRESFLFGTPFIFVLFLYPLFFGLYGKFAFDYGFLKNWVAIFFIAFSFNVIDWLILDWLLFCLITPKFIVISGTEGNPGYKNYWFHFIGFLKGCAISVIGSFVYALLVEGIGLLGK